MAPTKADGLLCFSSIKNKEWSLGFTVLLLVTGTFTMLAGKLVTEFKIRLN